MGGGAAGVSAGESYQIVDCHNFIPKTTDVINWWTILISHLQQGEKNISWEDITESRNHTWMIIATVIYWQLASSYLNNYIYIF